MIWAPFFSWFWGLTPFKALLWLGNRIATWFGMFHFWKRFRSQRLVWVWLLLINAASFGVLIVVFVLMKHRHVGP